MEVGVRACKQLPHPRQLDSVVSRNLIKNRRLHRHHNMGEAMVEVLVRTVMGRIPVIIASILLTIITT